MAKVFDLRWQPPETAKTHISKPPGVFDKIYPGRFLVICYRILLHYRINLIISAIKV